MIGIYLLKQGDEVVYVGQSIDIDLRLKVHNREKLKKFDNVFIIKCDKDNLDSAETFYIHHYMPKYNKKMYMKSTKSTIPNIKGKIKQKTPSLQVGEFYKPTNTNIAEFYGLDRKTIGTYKNSRDQKVRNRYKALKEHFIKAHEEKGK